MRHLLFWETFRHAGEMSPGSLYPLANPATRVRLCWPLKVPVLSGHVDSRALGCGNSTENPPNGVPLPGCSAGIPCREGISARYDSTRYDLKAEARPLYPLCCGGHTTP